MYQVSEEYLKQTKRKVQTFRLAGTVNKIAFTNHDILSGSFTITNQCSEQNDVKIGSVYIGELKCTFKPNLQVPDWTNAQIIVSEGLLIGGTAWEDVPLGVYTVSEANDTEYGVDITAYDNMARFNRSCTVDITIGTPYELLTLACTTCEVELGLTQADVDALPNGTESLSLYTENDIETWQDFIFWVAQATGTFTTMDRQGKLVLRQYGQTVVDTLTNHDRFTGSKFSKFETQYSGISVTNIKDKTTSYYGTEKDEYLTYNLGSNPFLQYGTDEYKETTRRNILNALLLVDYVPFETSVLTGAVYDLGDVVTCTGGIASGKMGCIMCYDYTFNGGYKLTGYGSDPSLASAKSKTDKNLSGLANNVNKSDILYYTFINAASYTVADSETVTIIDIKFVSSVAANVMFFAEILLEVAADDTIGTVTYSLNGTGVNDYHPVETWKNGKHIMSLMYMLQIDENSINRWQVKLTASGGTITINEGNIRAVVYGQGLVAGVEWDGYITIEETLTDIVIDASGIVVDKLTDSMLTTLIDPETSTLTETLSDIAISRTEITVDQIAETIAFEWIITSWTFTKESDATYSKRYVDTSTGSFKLNRAYTSESVEEPIDVGKMCAVSVDTTEFASVSAITISETTEEDVRFLVLSESTYYTVADSALQVLTITELSADAFTTYGATIPPTSELIITLVSPTVYKYTAGESIEAMTAAITAIPPEQNIQTVCDMSDSSIYGITAAEATHEGDVYVKLSYDLGVTYTDELLLADALTAEFPTVYEKLDERKKLTIVFIIKTEDESLKQFKYTFNNKTEV